ncbi:hypothetical protein CEF21_13575 [Bacillus sp. FJAT-42376]|uniref:hypothetical protein n=1 Tax=Bacillus sp. FJAT-42376 TaxID=2014076 RepID=UPI000F50F7C0|nr:hypothetical protein [Bacillus sp. FJAT-42376]AZB43250.1 hypothetical protein CEF21_13575 [Bacillus sp. FJAT-42376]
MEYLLKSKSSAIPCLIEVDSDSRVYMVRNADTSGKGFNTKEELLHWVSQNWKPEDFEQPGQLREVLEALHAEE